MRSKDRIQDSWLVLECLNGDKRAMELLVGRWHKRFCKHAYEYTGDAHAAADVAQESWRVILKKLHRLRDPEKFGSWALTIVHRNAINWLRKQKQDYKLKEDYANANRSSDTDHNHTNGNPLLIKLKMAISELPLKQKAVLNLFYLEGFSIREISNVLRISVGTVKSRLFHARESLKQELKL